MSMSNQDWIERSEAYLEGTLDTDEATAFEHDLVRPEVADAFRETLLLRELIRASTADEPPEELVVLIAASLGLDRDEPMDVREKARRLESARNLLYDLGWVARGPSLILAPVMASGGGDYSGMQAVKDGLSTMRYATASMEAAGLRRPGSGRDERKPVPLWRRAIKLVRRRRR